MTRNNPLLTAGREGSAKAYCETRWRPTGKFTTVHFDCGVTIDALTEDLGDPQAMLFKVPVAPLNLIVDVNLYNIVEPFGGRAERKDIEPVMAWLREGKVSLEGVSLRHVIPPGYDKIVEDVAKIASGKELHQYLCGLGAGYLAAIGKEFLASGHNSGSTYSGGWADVHAVDRSLFIECGTLNPAKVMRALIEDEPLMIIPYGGCVETDETKQQLKDVGYIFRALEKLPDELAERAARAVKGLEGHGMERLVKDEATLKATLAELVGAATVPVIEAPDGQQLVDRKAAHEAKRRIVRAPDFTRDEAPCDVGTLVRQAQRLYLRGRSAGAILAAFKAIGVRRGNGEEIELGDVQRWLAV
jgi:hypothetical protein